MERWDFLKGMFLKGSFNKDPMFNTDKMLMYDKGKVNKEWHGDIINGVISRQILVIEVQIFK